MEEGMSVCSHNHDQSVSALIGPCEFCICLFCNCPSSYVSLFCCFILTSMWPACLPWVSCSVWFCIVTNCCQMDIKSVRQFFYLCEDPDQPVLHKLSPLHHHTLSSSVLHGTPVIWKSTPAIPSEYCPIFVTSTHWSLQKRKIKLSYWSLKVPPCWPNVRVRKLQDSLGCFTETSFLVNLYRSFILPHMEYACPIWLQGESYTPPVQSQSETMPISIENTVQLIQASINTTELTMDDSIWCKWY